MFYSSLSKRACVSNGAQKLTLLIFISPFSNREFIRERRRKSVGIRRYSIVVSNLNTLVYEK
ncbi:hypothetical protein G4B88_022783 [Cannabis sativa]|uniref:Uncharacterized protein n=1 Tax=Cannabis sativa TaxID=3483 RepID=A0A7J6HZ65_CANSA|nr:hypothetical protein G4B88_022783 [Cannabis sativa]